MLDKYQRALEASEARFRTLIEKIVDGVIVLREDGAIVYASPAAEALLGWPAAELSGQMFGRPIVPGETTEIDLRLRRPEAANLPSRSAEMRVAEIDWEEQPALLVALHDITERKEAVRRRDEFLAMLAHELRNPLAPILNAAYLMRLLGLPSPELERARATIERQGEHLVRLLDDLLDLSRVIHGKIELRKQVVELAPILTDAIQASRALIDGRRHQLRLDLPAEPLRVEGDPTRLAQIMVNLLNNAAKYTEPDGRIDVSLCADGSQAVLRIADTGLGIPPDRLTSIFEPFTQLNPTMERAQGGMGIGLSLVRRLVGLHDGIITAHSEGPGRGSEFQVRLPLDARPTTAMPPPCSTPPPARRILLIEDNDDGREMLCELLRLWGHQVETAGEGLAGLELIRQSPPDAALVDIGLPGVDGYELARRVRALPEGDKVYLIAVTGYGQPEDRRRAQEAGFNVHLVKPVDLGKLMQLLAELSD